jgi:hypothetical protein
LENHFLDFLQWLRNEGEKEYRLRLETLLLATPLATIDDWASWVGEIEKGFLSAVQSWREDYTTLLQAWNETDTQRQANALRYQLSALYDTTVIEALADRQFLPRYGFPIGLQKLQVIVPDEGSRDGERVKIREEDQFRLERPGLLALREYVPGSQLLAGGKLITSRGLRKHWTGVAIDNYIGLTGQYAHCVNGHFYYEISPHLGSCPICDGGKRGNAQRLLLPKHGFSSAAWDPPRRSTDVERVGSVERATITFSKRAGAADAGKANFGGITGLTARYREAGEVLVYNSGAIWEEDDNEELRLVSRGKGFAICLKCGYADSERKAGNGRMDLPPGFVTHPPLTATNERSNCWRDGEAPVLRNQTLAARETTDVLLLTFESELAQLAKDESLLETLGHALRIAGAKLLELDTRELGVMPAPAGERAGEWGAVIYDNVPGGAGHVRELLESEREWLEEARHTLYVSEAHDAQCETACLDCLLTFDAQESMGKGLLQRRRAFQILAALLRGEKPAMDDSSSAWADEPTFPSTSLTNEERRARAQQRSGQRRR